MRLTVISTIIFAVCALLICTFSLVTVKNTVQEVELLRTEAIASVNGEQPEAALKKIITLEEFWKKRSRVLEMLIAHDDVHEIATFISDARVCLEVEDIDDFLRTAEQLKAAVEHITSVQNVSLGNLY